MSAERGRNPLPALLSVLLALALTVPALLAPSPASSGRSPRFPSRIAGYSWWVAGQSTSPVDAAVLLYQNGVGVEFLDTPQSVLLSRDGTSYRRFDDAEGRSIAADQGDPAPTLLSPDGTFALVAGADGHGAVEVVTLRDGARRSVPVGDGMSAVPVGLSADGRSALLLTSPTTLSRLQDLFFRLHGTLTRLDLSTGDLMPYPHLADVNAAALSPDGTTMLVDTAGGLVLARSADGQVVARLDVPGDPVSLDGDAWSPDGALIALTRGPQLLLVDPSHPGVIRAFPLPGFGDARAIGWRDAHSALVHAQSASDDNDSTFLWVDTLTGAREPFSRYVPGPTGAALGPADAARDLVPLWQVAEQPVDRGPLLSWPLALLVVLIAGTLAWRLTPRRRAATPVFGQPDVTASAPRAR